MTPQTPDGRIWELAKRIVADAADLPASGREAWVVTQCAGDAALLEEVRSLLAHLDDIDDYIEESARLPDGEHVAIGQAPERRVGAYLLGAEIGRGGMGVVYAARRADGAYEQTVAIKLLRASGSEQDARRMVRERQVLAQLEHPGIARLLDGGTTTQGEPYLVMEYVEGEAIDLYCESLQLNLRQRVALVRGVCAAVQGAHQRLLIHRDIKPSNILVTAQGEPKLLDFGIARMLEGEGQSGDTTHAATLLFTPRYASPEQLHGEPVTVATDVYGLGLLLYELLAGASPYERVAQSRSSSLAEAMMAVLQDTPRRASDVARRGAPQWRARARELEGELDILLLKACARQPRERYATVAQLDDDLARWLQGRPILARPQTWAYTLRKFVGRHRVGVGTTAVACGAIVAGVVGTVVQKERAEHRYAQVRQIANSFIFKYYDAIESLPGAKPVMKQMVGDGLKFLDDLNQDAASDVALAVELGAGYRRLALALYNGRDLPSLADKSGAAAASAKARGLLEAALRKAPDDARVQTEMAWLEHDEGALLAQEGNPDAGLAKFTTAIERLERVLARDPAFNAAGFMLPQTLLAAARTTSETRRPATAYLERAAQAVQRWAAHHPDDPEVPNLRLLVLRRQFMDAIGRGDREAAVRIADLEIAGYDAYLQKYPDNFLYGRYLHIALNNKGVALRDMGRHAQALQALDRGIEVGAQLRAKDPASQDAAGGHARMFFHRGKTYYLMGQLQKAVRDFERSAAEYHALDGKDMAPYITRHRGEVLWWQARVAHEHRDRDGLRRATAELAGLAQRHPEIFGKTPAADWVAQARRWAGT